MERQKRWQFFLILAVILLTVYNILPTIFYYSNPLKKPIGEKEASSIAQGAIKRVNQLEPFTRSWLKAQSKNIHVKPSSISIDAKDPKIAKVTFKNPKDAAFFAKTLYRAGSLIPFAPAQLSADPRSFTPDTKEVIVQRKIGVHLDPSQTNAFFQFVPKLSKDGTISPLYRELILDRVLQVALGFGGESENAKILRQIADAPTDDQLNESAVRLARQIVDVENAFGDQNPITQRFFASFTQTTKNKEGLISAFTARLEKLDQRYAQAIKTLKEEQLKLKESGGFLSSEQQQQLEALESQKGMLEAASLIVRRNASQFQAGLEPLSQDAIYASLQQSKGPTQAVSIDGRNPFIERIEIQWGKEEIILVLHPDVAAIRGRDAVSEADALQMEKLNQFLFNAIAQVARTTEETISPSLDAFAIQLTEMSNSTGFLRLDLGALAKLQEQTLKTLIDASWNRTSKELSKEEYPLVDTDKSASQLGIAIYAPTTDPNPQEGFRNGSIYVIAKGLGSMAAKYRDLPEGVEKGRFEADFRALQDLLRQNGFIGYYGADSGLPSTYKNDYIFELDDFYSYLLAATREEFSVKGNKHFALLELSDVEQRILTLNKIESREHEDLIKWRDEYQASRVLLTPGAKYDVPAPTQNVFLSNLWLSTKKYFRGDDRKILKWGLDLSGGKTVRIGLKDQNNKPITSEDDLKQAVNELYARVNKLGVSEVAIRIEGPTIVLDFPGSQGLTAADLIQASAMYFHVVNEKFTPNNTSLSEAVNAFLEEVWNEAVITNRTDPDSLNEIAWQHLGGNPEDPEQFNPLTNHARLLYDQGLRLAGSKSENRSSAFNDVLSSIAIFRGSDFADWQGQTHPLLIVFRNYALEGTQLADVRTGYDQSEGNILYFDVKGSSVSREGEKVNPREDFYAWTSQFSEEKITGTPKEAYSQGRGWRMAVILNGSIVNAPTLTSALRESARISGHFTQREVNQLAADLKAGSLSFTPHILSEENISPDLGKEQRTQGVFAAILGLACVFAIMCVYYRFGGVVASIAVLFNLMIMWGVLQNIGAALTLPGIAGIILTVAMSVDANVLVFERIREEFALSGRLPSAVQAGYRKAFNAIVDSNLTTIIAALILLNFDSGPIKGFALTIIIGTISSMFTSLFMTRYFFAGWVQNPEHKTLKMAKFFGETRFDFLGKAKIAYAVTALLLIVGIGLFALKKETIFGMDFTGGYALTVELKEKPSTDYRLAANHALENAGASRSDFQIRELGSPRHLRIQLGMSMQQQGKPFYHIDEVAKPEKSLFLYEQNPRIVWIVHALEQGGLELEASSLPQLSLNWTEMSGGLSDTMRNNAIWGLTLALLCILIYITFRFEFKYAISATLGLAHDLFITLGLIALLHLFYEGIQIDLQVIGALMMTVGYSLNDTIIIFDRIREEIKVMRKLSFSQIVNHALNATLSRTIITSGITLVVLIVLVIFGGPSIFNFALIMTIGIAVGTLSSLFIAAPLLLFFHNRELAKHDNSHTLKSERV